MTPPHTGDPAADSSFPPFEGPPDLKSQIPEHLLAGATPFEKHVIGELSIMRQHDEWSTQLHRDTNQRVRQVNGKLRRAQDDIVETQTNVKELQDDRKTFVGGWKLIVAIVVGFAGVTSFVLSVYQALSGSGH